MQFNSRADQSFTTGYSAMLLQFIEVFSCKTRKVGGSRSAGSSRLIFVSRIRILLGFLHFLMSTTVLVNPEQ